jgi:DNA-binding transcriptional ArsR family regulator
MAIRERAALNLDRVFAALSHPIRRAIIERLSASDATVNELAEPFGVSLPTISRHLAVLERAGLVTVSREWRVRRRRINAAPLSSAFGWLTQYRVLWEERLDRLGTVLQAEGGVAPSSKRVRRKERK